MRAKRGGWKTAGTNALATCGSAEACHYCGRGIEISFACALSTLLRWATGAPTLR
jgi:hypothetical protein